MVELAPVRTGGATPKNAAGRRSRSIAFCWPREAKGLTPARMPMATLIRLESVIRVAGDGPR